MNVKTPSRLLRRCAIETVSAPVPTGPAATSGNRTARDTKPLGVVSRAVSRTVKPLTLVIVSGKSAYTFTTVLRPSISVTPL